MFISIVEHNIVYVRCRHAQKHTFFFSDTKPFFIIQTWRFLGGVHHGIEVQVHHGIEVQVHHGKEKLRMDDREFEA